MLGGIWERGSFYLPWWGDIGNLGVVLTFPSELSPSFPQRVNTSIFICFFFVGFREDQKLFCVSPFNALSLHLQESTYGTHIHEKREEREARFCNTVHDIVNRGGRGLIPVFALGRAQELLLILGMYLPSSSYERAHKGI